MLAVVAEGVEGGLRQPHQRQRARCDRKGVAFAFAAFTVLLCFARFGGGGELGWTAVLTCFENVVMDVRRL
eukprot:3609654-Rhodomonas_salina.1